MAVCVDVCVWGAFELENVYWSVCSSLRGKNEKNEVVGGERRGRCREGRET